MELGNKNRSMIFPRINKTIIIVFAIVFILTGIRAYQLFSYIFDENVKTETSIIIPDNASIDQVIDSLEQNQVLNNLKAFKWVAKRKAYKKNIKPGHYQFKLGMNTNQIVNMLRAGNQKPIKLTFNNIRTFENLAGAISKYLQTDSIQLLNNLTKKDLPSQFGFNDHTFRCMFIPNTYEVYWTTTPEQFLKRMKKEYLNFWNASRISKAEKIGLSPEEVVTLASIVQEETIKEDEKAKVAGLYLNRLKKGMLLQADPTVKFALGDFTIRRVLTEHLKIDSPYNTYKYKGLPPGPINFPEISSIEAVLNAESHKYLYMCAKEDFSGYHNFSKNLIGHNANARKYQQALNKNRIFK